MPKCKNCNANMIKLLSRDGSVFYLCPHAEIHVQRSRLRGTGYMFCGVGVQARNTQPEANASEGLPHYMIDTRESADLYANLLSMRACFDKLTKDSKLTLHKLRKATHDTVNDMKLLESANLAIMLDLPIDSLPELFNSAMKLGHALDLKTQFAIESLCKGIGRRSYLILDNIGVNMRAETAYKWFASEHKLERLSDEQKRVAWQTYAIKLIKEKAEPLDANPKRIKREQIKTRIENLKAKVGKSL